MNTLLLNIVLSLIPASAFGDCGPEEWVTNPVEIPDSVRTQINGAFTIRLTTGAPTTFQTYFFNAGWQPHKSIPASKIIPISREPSCNRPLHPLESGKIPIIRDHGEFVTVIIDPRTGEKATIKAKDFNGFKLNFDSIKTGTYFSTRFLPSSQKEIRVFPFPDETYQHTLFPPQYSLFKVFKRKGDFVFSKQARRNKKSKDWEFTPIGWIRLKSSKGVLLLWPWYEDDC